jgi:hypothetical protein
VVDQILFGSCLIVRRRPGHSCYIIFITYTNATDIDKKGPLKKIVDIRKPSPARCRPLVAREYNMAKQSIISPQLSHLISSTEPMKYGEINTRINSLAGPTNRLNHLTYVTQQFGIEKFVSLRALPGLLPSPYSDLLDPCPSRHQQRPSTTHFTKQPLVHTLRLFVG